MGEDAASLRNASFRCSSDRIRFLAGRSSPDANAQPVAAAHVDTSGVTYPGGSPGVYVMAGCGPIRVRSPSGFRGIGSF